ncbi:hypothetical protein EXIGLDRAFT_173655 [Exidia glandulosa HHB12029]|uniref:F-box domain-containing protein n=1 Tax=Exidia glandulosa HHB12029 TaxID=1314781 RepID=A0A165F923_EXIGL|nr:hypothetical protein EXIGLDRAFT_173655 [Exidia glandulosa HHB12029]
MTSRAFSRPFLEELECEILERLGQHDLLSTSRVCRRFHAISAPLLLRHIARYRLVNEDGYRSYTRLPNTYKVVARLLHDGDICRHVRYFDMPTDVGSVTVPPDALRAMWLSMAKLVALSLTGRLIAGVLDWGLNDVYFPGLRRLRVDSNSMCPSLITLHIDSLTHLRLDDDVTFPSGDIQATSLTHYHGPLEAILRFATHAKTLQFCTIHEPGTYGRTDWPSLSSLTACRSLRTLMLVLEVPEAVLLRMLENCVRFPSIEILLLKYKIAWYDPTRTQVNQQDRLEPSFERLFAPFPTAKRIAVFDDYWDSDHDSDDDDDDYWLTKQGPIWAERLSKTCSNVEFIAFGEACALTRGPDQRWMASRFTWEFEETFGQWVVPAVSG